MDEPLDFDRLRRRGIALAQGFSGAHWTDYNLHDPGVTLLEAIAYALSELAYRADFPTADLLTGPDGRTDLARLGLGAPLDVLPMRPVTARDLALALTDSDPAVERVLVHPRRGAEAGLYDVHVVPAAEADPAAALAAVRRAFHAGRNLCEDLRTLALAEPVPCRLEARIEVRRRHTPERVAALIYDRCRRLMRDRGAARPRHPATRREVFDDPAALHAQLADPEGGAPALDLFFADLTAQDEVEDVLALAFRRLDAPDRDAFAPLAPGQYRTLVLPQGPEDVGLVLVSRDLPLPFDLAGMQAELARLRAGHVAELAEPLDRHDWAPLPPGRRRRFDHAPVGHTLPAAYGAGPERPAAAAPATEAARLRGYLALADALIANASADLAALPELFSGDLAAAKSYAARPLDLGPMPGLAAGGAGAVTAAVAALDPWHDRKGRVLEHLLALHGEEFSQNSLRLHDPYRGPAARRDAILANRARLLAETAGLARDRAGAPDYPTGERCHAVGLGRKLAILLDFPDRGTAPLAAALPRAGLALAPADGPDGAWRLPRAALAAADDPFAMLVPRRDLPPPADPAPLVAATPFLAGGILGEAAFRRGVAPEAWLLLPEPAGGWRLVLDPGGEAVLDAGRFPDRAAATDHAGRLRALLIDLNRRSEGAHLVEDLLLRGEDGRFAPMSLTVVLAGWSARTQAPGFRRLAEETVALLCPAQIACRTLWLDQPAMAAFEARLLDWRVASRDAGAGGPRPAALAQAGAALRTLLADPPPA